MPEFKLPDPGEGLVEAEIVTWKVKPGDRVEVNDVVVEVETAKSLVELPIPWAGTVTELLVSEGDTVDVGTPIIVVDTGAGETSKDAGPGEAAQDVGAVEAQPEAAAAAQQEATGGAQVEPPKREAVLVGYGASEGAIARRRRRGSAPETAAAEPEPPAPKALAKPPVRKYAKEKGVDVADVTPSREDGVITRADVDAYLAGTGRQPAGPAAPEVAARGAAPEVPSPPADAGQATPAAGPTPYTPPRLDRSGARESRTPVKGVRKMTAQAMTGSAFSAPHVTVFMTVDVSATMDLVERLKGDREFRGVKVSPLLIVAKATVLAVRRNPGVIAVWDEGAQEVVQKHYVNLGIAAATPRGLIVPNIKDADLMDLRQLAEAMSHLVDTARAGRTQPAEMSGGSITITNVGVFGVDTGTPIINPGESAIVCFGAIRKQPWVVTGADGSDAIVPRWVTQLSVSFDHRLIDGALGSQFLADLAAVLEDPSRALVWG